MSNADIKREFYQARPERDDFDSWAKSVENRLWWESANDNLFHVNHTTCPAAWTFVVATSDFWANDDPRDSLAAALVSNCPNFMRIISCGNYDRLFEYYDLGVFDYRKKHPRKAMKMFLAPRRSSVEHDIMEIWGAATSGTDHALPLSRCESVEDVSRILHKAKRELGVKRHVDAYARGASCELIVKAVRARLDVDAVLAARAAGVPEVDIFA